MSDPLYTAETWRDTRMHTVSCDLATHAIRPLPVGPDFPLSVYYREGTRPPQLAKQAGALASVGGGFTITTWHRLGVVSQPLHALVKGREVWTTGIGAGGWQYRDGPGGCSIGIGGTHITLWGENQPTRIDHVNRGHDGTVAFTPRGGTNEYPVAGRHPLILYSPGKWNLAEGMWQRTWVVGHRERISPVAEGTIAIESDAALPYELGSTVVWKQWLGPQVMDVVAGPTPLVLNGRNAVSVLNLIGSHGPDAWYVRKNPRTAVGIGNNGTTGFLVVAEGRVEGSLGLRLKEFANYLIHTGITDAINLDGGGSSHMWIRGTGLVADSCYGDGTLDGIRPNVYATAIMERKP